MNLRALLHDRFTAAFEATGIAEAEPLLRPAARPEFGHYQANGIMAAAKQARRNPRQLAEAVVGALREGGIDAMADTVEVAGPGFVNVTLAPAFLAAGLSRPGIEAAPRPDTIVIDYSSPNLAKEMHVGHLRTTIGDAMARVLEALGHTVIRQNHVGDWGTQFGMLVAHLDDRGADSQGAALADLETFYASARQRFDADPAFAQRARRMVVALQRGDAAARRHWERFIEISLTHCRAVYDRLGITLTDADLDAESRYNDHLPGVVEHLDRAGLLSLSDGAKCVFLDGFDTPVIVQKSDGGYLYATTDLAAVRHRCQSYGANRLMYFTDARQSLHFRQFFAVARQAGFAPPECRLEHHPFGAIKDRGGRAFKSRDGGTEKLAVLLEEAVRRADALVRRKSPELGDDAVQQVARVVGIGAVKYADLLRHRASDYVFDWDAMLSFDGNTAPYLQYAYARIRSLFRRADADPADLAQATPTLGTGAERQLALALLRFQETLEAVAAEALPHYLCGYVYELAGAFMRFYETCAVLDAPPAIRRSRLRLCALTADTLRRGLGLLGIDTVERM